MMSTITGDGAELAAAQRKLLPGECLIPPVGWQCSRRPDHGGPCAAIPSVRNPLEPRWQQVSDEEFKIIRDLRNALVKVVPCQNTSVTGDIDSKKATTAPLTSEDIKRLIKKSPTISEQYAESMVGHLRPKVHELPPDALIGYDPDHDPVPSDLWGTKPKADHDVAVISQQIHQFEGSSRAVLDRIMALEADPPAATKPRPAPPTVEYLVTLVKSLQDNQRALLGRLVALEQGRKFHAVNDLTHPFED